jgi:hypothetical protein
MQAEDVTAFLRKRPLIPLRIHMTDGHRYDVHHPEVMVVSRSHAMVGLQPDPATGVDDRIEHCGLIHIVRIEEMPVTAAGSSSGASA